MNDNPAAVVDDDCFRRFFSIFVAIIKVGNSSEVGNFSASSSVTVLASVSKKKGGLEGIRILDLRRVKAMS